MRLIIYSELGTMYSNLSHFYKQVEKKPDETIIKWAKKQLKEVFLKFGEGERYVEDNKATFVQLPERSTISEIYSAVREVFGPEEEYGFQINSGLAIEEY